MYTHKLNMPKMKAWNAFQQYRKALGTSASPEDKAIMAAYKALSKGKTVIDLKATIQDTGAFPNGLPKLAIVRADFPYCYCEVRAWGEVTFAHESLTRKNATDIVRLPHGTLPRRPNTVSGKAQTPHIPPQFRPKDSMLSHYYILWEAVWEKMPPRDPILLKPLGGGMYAVVACWDLSEVERTVLSLKTRNY